MNIKKRTYILGVIFGLIVPYIGIVAGLVISSTLGNILAFPLLIVATVTGKHFGAWDGGLWLAAMLLSIIIWTGVFIIIDKVLQARAAK